MCMCMCTSEQVCVCVCAHMHAGDTTQWPPLPLADRWPCTQEVLSPQPRTRHEHLAPAAMTPAPSPGGARHRRAGVCRCHSTAALRVAKASTAPISRI